jgi:hypothetical protein
VGTVGGDVRIDGRNFTIERLDDRVRHGDPGSSSGDPPLSDHDRVAASLARARRERDSPLTDMRRSPGFESSQPTCAIGSPGTMNVSVSLHRIDDRHCRRR